MSRSLSIGRFELSSYMVMLYLGCVGGTLAGAAFAEDSGLSPTRFAAMTILLLVPAFAGARLLFVTQHFEAFRTEPQRIWRRGEGGSSLYGGLVLAVVCSVPVLALAGLPFLAFWDAAAVTMLLGLIVTRFGCLLNGCCSGRPTSGWLGVNLPDHSGNWRRRYPTPMLEAGWAAVILGWVLAAGPDPAHPGTVICAVVAAYAASRLVLEPTRETLSPGRERRVNMAVSAVLLVVAGSGLVAVGIG